jgi:hypothetical protein
MLELLPPLDPEEPEEPDDPPDEPPEELGMLGDEGMLEEEEEPAQPPIRNAETVPIAVACAAITSRRSIAGLLFIAFSGKESGTQRRSRRPVAAAWPRVRPPS